jgi:hypothetical protein
VLETSQVGTPQGEVISPWIHGRFSIAFGFGLALNEAKTRIFPEGYCTFLRVATQAKSVRQIAAFRAAPAVVVGRWPEKGNWRERDSRSNVPRKGCEHTRY